MNIKTSRWTLLAAIIFTINIFYWYWKYPDDTIGIFIFSVAAGLFYVASIGNWKGGN
jgi:hypothetical protein